jgi:hypothetical protein
MMVTGNQSHKGLGRKDHSRNQAEMKRNTERMMRM